MRKALSSLLALGAILICLPASAQTVSSVTVNPAVIQGGQTATVTVTLSGTSTSSTTVSLALLPGTPGTALLVPSTILPSNGTFNPGSAITIQAGATTGSFSFTTLPVDTASEVQIGATANGGPWVYARLFLQRGPGWQTRIAVFRPNTSEWILRNEDGTATTVQYGGPGDLPVQNHYTPNLNFPRFQQANIAVFRRSTSEWFIRNLNGTTQRIQFGGIGDWPMPADYLGLNYAQLAVFQANQAQVVILDPNTNAKQFVAMPGTGPGMIPEAFNFLGSSPNHGQAFLYNPANDTWTYVDPKTGGAPQTVSPGLGLAGDLPVPGDYLGLGHPQIAYYRPSTATWIIQQANGTPTTIQFGQAGQDIPVPGDYLGLSRYQVATYRPATGEWRIQTPTGQTLLVPWGGIVGGLPDVPVPERYGPRFGPLGP